MQGFLVCGVCFAKNATKSWSLFLDFNFAILIWPCQPHRQATCYNLQFALHQLKDHAHRHEPKSLMDQLPVAELRNYNKRWTRYFVKSILILMRIIYYLSCACWYCSGSPRRIKDHTRTRPVLQNSLKEAVITFFFPKAIKLNEDILEILSSLLSKENYAEYFWSSINNIWVL